MLNLITASNIRCCCLFFRVLKEHISIMFTFECHETSLTPPVKMIFTDRSRAVLPLWILCYFMFRVCHAVLSVHCSRVVTCWQRANLLAITYVMFSCVHVTFPCGVLCQVWYLIISIPYICLLHYFDTTTITVSLCLCECKLSGIIHLYHVVLPTSYGHHCL